MLTVERLRADAIRRTFFTPTRLKSAIDRLGFVQADPIRSPARAQDLILRHRVKGYRAGDLEHRYAKLDIEEDLFYAYGFLPRSTWQLIHPRNTARLTNLEKRVLEVVRGHALMHPRELEGHLGRERMVNAWGGYSKATTHALQRLHYRGLLRVAKRENGIRIYQAAPPFSESLSSRERLEKVVLLASAIFAPVPLASLREILRFLKRAAPALDLGSKVITDLLRIGQLESAEAEGLAYVWPTHTFKAGKPAAAVRFLAPFDPLVWDRRRFEHLWGWPYRFEAYTPAPKRQRGYYAMPLLWQESVIGWANISFKRPELTVKLGFVEQRPESIEFQRALDEEIEAFRNFLQAAGENATLPPNPV